MITEFKIDICFEAGPDNYGDYSDLAYYVAADFYNNLIENNCKIDSIEDDCNDGICIYYYNNKNQYSIAFIFNNGVIYVYNKITNLNIFNYDNKNDNIKPTFVKFNEQYEKYKKRLCIL